MAVGEVLVRVSGVKMLYGGLQMRRDGKNRDIPSFWTVIKEYPVSSWCILLCIGFKDFFSIRPGNRIILVCLQAWVAGIIA